MSTDGTQAGSRSGAVATDTTRMHGGSRAPLARAALRLGIDAVELHRLTCRSWPGRNRCARSARLRALLAAELRRPVGGVVMTWARIAELLGYAGHQTAMEAARRAEGSTGIAGPSPVEQGDAA